MSLAKQLRLTNEQVMEKLLYQQLQNVLDAVPEVQNGLIIQADSSGLLTQWVMQKSGQWFLKRGINVLDVEGNPPDSFYILKFQLPLVNIFYYEEGRDLLFRVKRYRRTVEFFLPFTVKNSAGLVQYSFSDIVKYQDELERSRLSEIESPLFDFTRGEKVASKWVRFFLEPVVVTLSTIAVVYLFYALRSGS